MTRSGNIIFAVLLLLILLCQFPFADVLKCYLFCVPTAFAVAGPLSGGTCSLTENAVRIAGPDAVILMPPSCSGITFFFLVCLLFLFFGKWKWMWCSYPFALLINGVRVLAVTAWTLKMESRIPLPGPFQHMMVGLIIFLSALIFLAFLLNGLNRGSQNVSGKPLNQEKNSEQIS